MSEPVVPDAVYEAGPDIVHAFRKGWDAAVNATEIDVARLADAIHADQAELVDHTGPVCHACREDAANIAAEYRRLSGNERAQW